MGTDNEKLLADPLYLGLRQKRRPLADNVAFLDEFMVAFREVFPSALVQFEDFSSEAAFFYLDRYRDDYCMFNDDVQGTGSVILSGFINAAVKSAEASGRPLADQKIGTSPPAAISDLTPPLPS
jgi:malate dehydrogenase (oxaloacetate-decarboxylating)(NADP+)